MSTAAVSEGWQARASGESPASQRAAWDRLSLRANFSWAVAGNAVYAGCQWGVLAVLARLASAEALGEYAFGVAVAAPVMVFSMLHLRAIQATDARGEFAFGEFLALRLATTFTGMLVIAAVAVTGSHMGSVRWLIVISGVVVSADALSDIFAGALQRKERLDRVAVAMVAKGILGLLAVVAIVSQGGGALGAALALAVVRWLVLATYELPTASRVLAQDQVTQTRPIWRGRRLVRLGVLALPLGLVMLLMSLQANVPRYWLKYEAGAESLGVFVGLMALTQLGSLVVNALGQAASPRLAKAYQAGEHRTFFRLTARLVLVGGVFGLLGVSLVALAGPQVLTLVYGPEYAAQAPAFLVLMVAAAVLYTSGPLGYAATAARRIRLQPVVHVVNLAVTIAVAWFASSAGVLGMAWVTLAASLTSAILFVAILAVPEAIAADGARHKLA